MNILLCWLAAVGLSHLIVDSKIGRDIKAWLWPEPPTSWLGRQAHYMTNCLQCSGWWSGLAVAPLTVSDPVTWVACAFAASFLSPFARSVHDYFDAVAAK